MKNRELSNDVIVSLRGIINKVNLLYEDVVPDVNVYMCKGRTASGKIRLSVVVGLHDIMGNLDRARYSLTLPEDIPVKEAKNQCKLIEQGLSHLLKQRFDTYYYHDFLDELEKFVSEKRGKIRDNTVDGYETRMKKIQQYFGKYRYAVESITSKEIAEFVDWMESNGKCAGSGMSYHYIKDVHGLLYGFFKSQIRNQVISVNPCENTVLNKAKSNNVKETTVRWLNIDEYNRLMDWLEKYSQDYSCPFGKLYDMIRLAIYSGMRKEEILALQWDVVDFKGGHFEICRTRTRGKEIYDFDDVKTPASHRNYPITPDIEGLLIELKKKAVEECNNSKYVFSWSREDINLTDEDNIGKPYSPDYIVKIMKKMVDRYKKETGEDISGFTFHKLRHSCASILFDKGWSLEEVQQWLGHDDSEVTKKIYIHKQEKWKDSKAKTLDFLWKKHNWAT